MPTRSLEFTGSTLMPLSGRVEMPEGLPRAWAVFAHCLTCGKDNIAAVRIARALAAQGIGVLRFDFAGLGDSEGEFAETSFATNVADLVAAVTSMTASGMTPSLLIGHSFGGAAVLAAAGQLEQIKAVATIAAPFDVAHVLHHFAPDSLEAIARDGMAKVPLAGRTFAVGRQFLDDLRSHDQGARIAALHRPLLILHAPQDDVVGIDNATRIFMAARHPKSFISLDNADHLLSGAEDARYAAGLIAAWASRYLPPLEQTREGFDAQDVVAEETREGRYQVAIRAGGLRFLADEPVSVGGMGSGPTPYDLLSAALGACTTMTLRLYADGKGWPVNRIQTAVGHVREAGVEPADLFTRRIAVDGALDAAQRARLLEIADRCPVHRTLEKGSRVMTRLGDPPAQAERIEAHAEEMARMMEHPGG
ncbi:bifunctional alpha/beta hydrolase/OsmC family protein [Sphingomonas quercus]|uniref:Bifunctional alpha/beta hydrolase/OsmC family protein n=1 Tax=Sphingomonas quercus TaxID=2842451 RepID=A0ABS6BKT9_9SPHN|nr:bifunctional alpha/beta hydrolase/OsmC family protein [Sphingomonas quercus]MBU3078928.1 bifunctional alpha/beta hydrolase/OsmC family protein [Sphingomonas quercus]